MIYNEEFETLPREVLEALQLKRLKQVVQRVYHTVGFYRRSFDEAGVQPDDIKTLDDLKKFPFTTKQDLRDNYPFGLFAVPMSSVVRLHASSGTTGRSTVVGYTKRDIDTWSELMARCFVAAGLTKNDMLHNAYGYGLFTGGLGAHYGAEKLGASVIPMSGGNTKRQIMILQDFGPTAICCTPSYALNLAEQGREMGIDMKSLKLRVGIFGAEPWSEKMRTEIENALGIKALNIYGLSEIMGPGVAMECLEGRNGMHIFEDHFLVETIDPATGAVLPPGRGGGTGLHDDHERGLSPGPLPDEGHLPPDARALPLRPDTLPDGPRHGPERRYADHPGGQCLPLPDRGGPCGDQGAGTALPDHRGPRRQSRYPGNPG